MAFVPLKRPLAKKPSLPRRLDRSNMLASGMTCAILPEIAYDAASDRLHSYTDTGTPAQIASREGKALNCPNSDWRNIEVGKDWSASSYTAAFVMRINDATPQWGGFLSKLINATDTQWAIGESSNADEFYVAHSNAGLVTMNGINISTYVGKWARYVITWDGTNVVLYVDEVTNFSSEAFSTAMSTGSDDFVVGASRDQNDTYDSDVDLALFTFSEGVVWSYPQIQAFMRNPWQIFQPQTQYIEIGAAAGGTSVNATTGTLTLTGLNPTVKADVDTNISATAGALTLTGLNATVKAEVDTNVSATTGALTLTALDASITAATNVSASLGTLTLTPHAANVTHITSRGSAPSRKRKKIAPKKYKDPRLEQLIKDLVALRNKYVIFDADETPYEEQLSVIHSEHEKAEKIKAEIIERIELIKAKTTIEIAYREYVYGLIRDIQEKRNQLLEDELVSILLLVA